MIAYRLNIKNMMVEKVDMYFEITSRGAIVFVNDDVRKYVPKGKVDMYVPFGIDGKFVMIFNDDYKYELDKVHNGFIDYIINSKREQRSHTEFVHKVELNEIDRKIEYFESHLKSDVKPSMIIGVIGYSDDEFNKWKDENSNKYPEDTIFYKLSYPSSLRGRDIDEIVDGYDYELVTPEVIDAINAKYPTQGNKD